MFEHQANACTSSQTKEIKTITKMKSNMFRTSVLINHIPIEALVDMGSLVIVIRKKIHIKLGSLTLKMSKTT